jgi:hypothetical protein
MGWKQMDTEILSPRWRDENEKVGDQKFFARDCEIPMTGIAL